MFILRALGLFLLLAIAVCVGLGMLSRQPHYFRWAWSLFRYGVVVALIFMALFILERLIAPII
ncbi:hypothetical protein Q9Q94_01215 [Uliginosibacterium sp. 31-16]|uniref:hypothetical protein n=1 Tax=Uliginosibacterium sp. 31-16 TaxID=3068315 RepID=UPI0027400330|nr:hypothetical protein [Uliginosibacterium sp. 31-16]MDP5238127.1 hypothetical protein [Uliginosibacterium sp. 31-16]